MFQHLNNIFYCFQQCTERNTFKALLHLLEKFNVYEFLQISKSIVVTILLSTVTMRGIRNNTVHLANSSPNNDWSSDKFSSSHESYSLDFSYGQFWTESLSYQKCQGCPSWNRTMNSPICPIHSRYEKLPTAIFRVRKMQYNCCPSLDTARSKKSAAKTSSSALAYRKDQALSQYFKPFTSPCRTLSKGEGKAHEELR